MRLASTCHARPAGRLVPSKSRVLGALLFLLGAGCSHKTEDPRREPPPPPPAAHPAACAGGGGKIADGASAAFFPQAAGGFCVDPNGGEKTYGDGASLPLDGICDLFDGECEIYKDYSVRRVVEARYVDGGGSPATIDVHLSKFAASDRAYAMFTRRVVGDGDPADEATPRPTPGGGAAALGLGNAYLWRGLYLVELTYNNQDAAEAAIKTAGDKLLPPLVKDMGDRLPGELALPPAAAALPKESLLPLGVRYVTKDLLADTRLGAGAFGYYRAGDKRWRVASVSRADADQAKDVIATLGQLPGAAREKNVAEGAVRFMHKDAGGSPVEWIFARAGKQVLGVGDEARALRAGMTADEHAKIALSRDEKIDRLKKYLAP
jgi:hypothetical protein